MSFFLDHERLCSVRTSANIRLHYRFYAVALLQSAGIFPDGLLKSFPFFLFPLHSAQELRMKRCSLFIQLHVSVATDEGLLSVCPTTFITTAAGKEYSLSTQQQRVKEYSLSTHQQRVKGYSLSTQQQRVKEYSLSIRLHLRVKGYSCQHITSG